MLRTLSLKYRIALIIFVLEAIMMLVVLSQSLGQSYEASSEQIKQNQAAILELVSGISQSALITEEYAELQPYIDQIVSNTNAHHFILADSSNTIVASNIPAEIGSRFRSEQLNESKHSWQERDIFNASGLTGRLAIAFSDQTLSKVYKDARDFGIGIALTGMIIIAAVGILVGHLLTRRLTTITNIAREVSNGHYEYRTEITSHDELGLLAQTFDQMVQHFVDNKNELNIALHNVQTREQELVESEARFRQLAENINEVFWLGSPDWNQVYYVSPAYAKDWGRDPEKLYDDAREWIAAVHDDDRQQVINDIPQQLDDNIDIINFQDYRIVNNDGDIMWIKARAFPIRDNKGQVIRIAGIAENITERKANEDGLRQAQKMDALGKLTGGIAHDFNNMLGVILGYAELIEQLSQNSDPKFANYAHEIHKAGERGSKLTQKLLSFSRKKASDTQVININQQLSDLKQMLQKTLTVRIALSYQLAEDAWPCNIDAAEFDDAIVNICINALHAIKDKGKITISTSNQHIDQLDARSSKLKTGDYVLISITDTGTGMSADTLEQVFVPFFTTKGDEGTGLGLSQVYGFMERSNGTIKVYSELDHGTRVSLYFPRHSGSEKNLQQNITTPAKKHQGSESILLVDDEVALLDYAKEVLQLHGYTIFTAENAQQALDVLQQLHIDLLFSDIIMPNMDGFELAELVKQRYPHVKIQLASGFSESHDSDNIDQTLKANILPKPYNSSSLLSTIQAVLNSD